MSAEVELRMLEGSEFQTVRAGLVPCGWRINQDEETSSESHHPSHTAHIFEIF